ncbi:DUF2480 family protein [Sphingobacterium spiritivorum]|uniref:DUF2480 family protein n=1 Tax=Sphingobacterium spiritivorum TaxID=258 RepID=UPI003DA21B99
MTAPIVNKVQQSGIIGLDLMDYAPQVSFVQLDIKDMLYMGMMLREKEFREKLQQLDFSLFAGKAVTIMCSSDAIVPQWAYMLLTTLLRPYAFSLSFGEQDHHYQSLWINAITAADFTHLKGTKVAVRNDIRVPEGIYMAVTSRLLPLVSGLMYGEVGMPKVIYKK